MKTTTITVSLGIITAGSLFWAAHTWIALEDEKGATAAARQLLVKAGNLVEGSQRKLLLSEARARAAEEDVESLLSATRSQRNASDNAGEQSRLPDDLSSRNKLIEERYNSAIALLKLGAIDGRVLKDLFWCYDQLGLVGSREMRLKRGLIINIIGQMAQSFPPALAALQERRELAVRAIESGQGDFESINAVTTLNRLLGEQGQTLSLYDKLLPNDPRRKLLASGVFEPLIISKRYNEAVQTNPYSTMSAQLELGILTRSKGSGSDSGVASALVDATAKNIEALIGAGQSQNAQALAQKLLAVDSTPATKARLSEAASKAGQPAFFGQ